MSFTSYISRINNTHIDDDVVMPMYNLTEHSDNYSKPSGNLVKYCRGKPAINDDDGIVDFTKANSITDLL